MNKFRSSLPSVGRPVSGRVSPLVAAKRGRGVEGDNIGSIPVDRAEIRSADHRDGDRHRLETETVTIVHEGHAREAELVNLSGGGAMIQADFMPRLWDRVDLGLGEGSPIECAVRWIRGDRIGLEFAHETRIEGSPEQRDAILLDVIRRTFPDVEEVPAPPLPETCKPSASDAHEGRGERRHPLIWTGQIVSNGYAHAVRLRNISTTGALVESSEPLPEGATVVLDLGSGVEQPATVGWNRGEQSGLVFAEPFDLARLAEARPEMTPQRWVRPGFLDLAPAQDSPWDARWDRPTVQQLREDLEGYLKY